MSSPHKALNRDPAAVRWCVVSATPYTRRVAYTAYTVDRSGTLSGQGTIGLEHHNDVDPPPLQAHVDSWFPAGVTWHGERYLLRPAPPTLFEPGVELTCELVRQAEFPQLPSRFQSVFACETLADAKLFLANFGDENPGARIVEVETDLEPFRADMHCLDICGSVLVSAYGARRYWRQEPNDLGSFPGGSSRPAFWELLLRPPVRVLRQVFSAAVASSSS